MSLLILPRRFREMEIDLKNETGTEFLSALSAKYMVEVCRNGKVICQPFGPKPRKNLITNGAFDYLMQQTAGSMSQNMHQALMNFAHCGTGTTAPANSDIKLTAATQASSSVLAGGGNFSTNDTTNGAISATLVYEFPAVGAGVTLNECGLANTSTLTLGLMTHALFPSGVTLNVGDNLRLTYTLTYSIPCLVTPITVSLAAVNGFNISGTMKVCGLYANIWGSVGTNGWVAVGASNYYFLPSLYSGIPQVYNGFMTNTAFPAVNTNFSETNIASSNSSGSQSAYTAGSLTRNFQLTWSPSQPVTTVSGINMIRLMSHQGAGTGLYLLLSNPGQTKANTNTLTINMTVTMVRG